MTKKEQLILFKNILKFLAFFILIYVGYMAAVYFSQTIGMYPPCSATFPLEYGVGCPDDVSCVDAAKLTPKHGCASSNGICPVSPNTLKGAKNFVNIFNSLSRGGCTLRVSSAIQRIHVQSSSTCHLVGEERSGTCIDFNVEPPTDTCFNNFYNAAAESETVRSYVNEYKPLCYQSTQSGGNIHTNFAKSPEEPELLKIKLYDNNCDEDCIMTCAIELPGPFGGEVIGQDKECLSVCNERVKSCMEKLMD